MSLNKNILTPLLAYLGVIIFLIGGAINFSEHWNVFNNYERVLLTLGIGLVLYYLALVLNSRSEILANIFDLASAILFFLGFQIVFISLGFSANSFIIQELTAFILGLTYLLAFFILRKNSLMAFSIIFFTYLFLEALAHLDNYDNYWSLNFAWQLKLLISLGLVYYAMGIIFSKNSLAPLTSALYFFGSLFFFSASLFLSQTINTQTVNTQTFSAQSLFWNFMLLASVFIMIFFSVLIKSKMILTWSALFLIIDVLSIAMVSYQAITTWSATFMTLGILLILVGCLYWPLIKKINLKKT